ncbi:efflux RND transporter periplasmic adaptor subunit [Thalassomonas actiniarum]|uniref:Efflux RND transporter periplasmic adaptor subunit n=1 Tax=Thalassomonas actiniarum TaxID=485447 RepID=A0AAF0C200_9GAMM|nr:efflux RND transporter periplasmic adaptor subunit [Thalassomonas actiniarum]WDD97239.1 efflux RND transporter periplasmic adaptor subunit [Thalassomonas actiniarum]
MDRAINNNKQKTHNRKRYIKAGLAGCAIGVFVLVFTWSKLTSAGGKTYNLAKNNLMLSQVKQQAFAEYLPVRAVVEPEKTIFIDAIDGGRVEQVYLQEGALVEKDQPILKLSNTGLQLTVLAREAEVSEQINNMRNTRLALEQNQLSLKRDVIELDFEVQKLEKRFARSKRLVKQKLISEQEFEEIKDELAYQKRYRETVRQSQEKEALLQEQQLAQLSQSIKTLENNLAISQMSLDKLIIRAPVSGQLTFLDAQVGESKRDGQRLGQVDLLSTFKVSARIDEFYVSRIAAGQEAEFSLDGQRHQLTVSKVYPGIDNGTFKVDFTLADANSREQLRLGQSLQAKLNLSASENKLQISNGAFMQTTGGNWVFVVSADGSRAEKRQVRLGRRNPQSVEVLEGLAPGESVITSSYASFADAEQVQLLL